MKLYVLGTGAAGVTKCYNTCFTLSCSTKKNLINQSSLAVSEDKKDYFLVDGGGGNAILSQLQKSNIDLMNIHHIFVSHNHIDHIIGIIWVMRRIADGIVFDRPYEGNLNIYCSDVTVSAVKTIADLTLNAKQRKTIEERVKMHTVSDGETMEIMGKPITFFDIHATKEKQFGFKLSLNSEKDLVFLGDEPCNEKTHTYIQNAHFVLCEAFCLYDEREKYRPYEKGHYTVKEGAELAEKMNIQNLLLWHTMDNNLSERKKLYTLEAKQYFKGNVFVPDDLDVIDIG